MRWLRRRWLVVLAFAFAALWGLVVHPFLVIVAGYGATIGGLLVLGGGDSVERVMEERIPGHASFLRLEVDREAGRIEARALYVTRTAVFRPGIGATREAGRLVELPPALPELSSEGAEAVAGEEGARWPQGDAIELAPLADDVDAGQLDAALGRAWAAEAATHALLVVHRGELVRERYANSKDRDTPLLGWSMTKSVTGALVGRLVHEGELELHAPAPVEEWSGDARAEITLAHLLRMNSGLAWRQEYTTPYCDSLNMLFVAGEASAAPRAASLAHPVGELWSYSDGTSNVLARIVQDAVSRDLVERLAAPRTLLFEPLGMTSAFISVDGSGTFVGSSLMMATARDWARFGLLHARDGVWEGERLLPEGWVDWVAEPTAGSAGLYGAHVWRIATGPCAGVFGANGYQGQYVFVDRERDVVLVRLGFRKFERQGHGFAEDVLAAFP